jgi:hypothetical protein
LISSDDNDFIFEEEEHTQLNSSQFNTQSQSQSHFLDSLSLDDELFVS